MDKQTAITILEDIQNSLNQKDWKKETSRTISQYEKGLKITTSKKIQKLVNKQKEYIKKYGENRQEEFKIE